VADRLSEDREVRGQDERSDVPTRSRGHGVDVEVPEPSPDSGTGRTPVDVQDGPPIVARLVPPLTLLVVLAALGLVVNAHRLGLDLAGGRLLPVGDLGELWSAYLAGWHQIGGGTASSAPTALAVLGAVGALFLPLGGPHALVAVLMLGDAPLAGLSAYLTTRRLPASRWIRAGAAALYALLPTATASVAQGRLDVVVAHILLPPVIAGVAGLLVRTGRGLLHTSSWCALGLASLGAFSPLALVLALLGLVVGFVVLPSDSTSGGGRHREVSGTRSPSREGSGRHRGASTARSVSVEGGGGRRRDVVAARSVSVEGGGGRRAGMLRRAASVAIVVLLPLALLLPWPAVVVNQPALLVQGLSGPGVTATPADLLGLNPGGAGGLPFGIVVVVAAVVAVVVRPRSLLSPGFGVVLVGVCGLLLVRLVPVRPLQGSTPEPGFAGVPLLVIGAGLLWLVLTAVTGVAARMPRLLGVAWAVLVVAAGVGAFVGGRGGPLHAGGGDQLSATEADELAGTGRSALVLGEGDEPARQSGGRLPLFGDDQLAPTPGTPERLAGWQAALEHPASDGTRAALSAATASGALFVVLPHGMAAAPIVSLAPDLAVAAAPTRDGRPVLRLLAPSGQVVLVPPGVAKQAVTTSSPATSLGITPVAATLPEVRVRVSDGVAGRLLVLSAEQEPGWWATVDGRPVPIVPAWGHQVAVAVPTGVSTVVVEHSSAVRDVLLLIEIAALLFAALTSVPGRRTGTTRRR
jgi:hypothetical protein